MNLSEFTGKDLSEFAENFGRFLRMTSQTHASGRVKCELLLPCCKTKYSEKQVKQIVTKSATFADVLVALERQYPTYETDLSIRAEIQNLAVLPNNPKPARISELLADLDHWVGRLMTRSRGGPATGRCGGHAQVSRQAKHYAHKGINALMSCDKAFQDPCHSATRERKYVQQHIRICTHGAKTGLG